ncbi:MAG: acetylxylan esterase [Bacteroidales bacterium]|nr:acetylxylan esterase [Bacteroidales bacterium]
MRRFFYSIVFICLVAGSAYAQPRIDKNLKIELDMASGLYSVSDTVKVTATPLEAYDKPLEMEVFENGTLVKTIKLGVINSKRVVYTDVRTEPVAVMLEFREEGTLPEKIPMNLDQTEDTFRIGYVVEGTGFRPGFKAPANLKSYWARQIRNLRNHKMEAVAKPVALKGEEARKYECFDVEINSLDTIPVRGYVARPKNAAKGSLPIVIQLHAAGVSGNWCNAKVRDAVNLASYGAIAFDFNAHGMLNDADESYYKELENGRLFRYSSRPINNKKDYYFRMMFLRAIRALDYITQDPAWDGKTIMLLGESQGGAQAAAMAGLDDRVSDVVINVPAGVGNGGFLLGRNDAWPYPAENNGIKTPTSLHMDLSSLSVTPKNARKTKKVAPYFDGALLLKGCKARFLVEIGLVDTTCPPSEVFSGINGVEGPVQVICSPYRNHWSNRTPAQYMPSWKENIQDYRQNYIKQRLAGHAL